MDGKVIIKTELDNKSFESQIKETESELRTLEKSADESKIPKKFRRSADETRNLNSEIEKTKNKLIQLKQKQNALDKNDLSNVQKNINSIGNGISKTISKVGRWALAVFAIESAYGAVRNAVSTLSQYNEQMATDIEYIQFALATTLQPVIEKIINLVYRLLVYVNYLAKAWFNVELFSKASASSFKKAQNSTSKMSKDTKEIAKNLADGIDEITNLDMNTNVADNSIDDNIKAPSFDLSTQDVTIPKWLEWLSKNGKLIKDVLLGIGTAIATIKIAKLLKDFGKFGSILNDIAYMGIAAGMVSIADSIYKIYGAYNDLKQIMNEQESQTKNNVEGTSNLIKKYEELRHTTGLTAEQQKAYVNYLLNGIEANKRLIDSKEEQKNWWTDITGETQNLTNQQNLLNESNREQLNILKELYNEGLLNSEQKKRYKKLLELEIESISKANEKISRNSEEYKKNKIEIDKLKDSYENLTGKEYKIKTSLEKPKTNVFKNTLNDLIASTENIFDSFKGAFTGKYNTIKLPRLAKGGLVNNPGKGVNMGSYVAGERGAEAILPLQNSRFVNDFANQIASQMDSGLNTELLLELNRNISELADRPIILSVNGKQFAQATFKDYKIEEKRLNSSNTFSIR